MGRLSNPRDEPRTRPFLIKNLPPDAGFSHFTTKWASITLTEQFARISERIAGYYTGPPRAGSA
jgi:hypothetical protein